MKPGYPGAIVTFWWGANPLGNCIIPADQFPLSLSQVSELAASVISPAVIALIRGRDTIADEYVVHGVTTAFDCDEISPFIKNVSPDLDVIFGDDISAVECDGSEQLTVIICTKGRGGDLFARCLRSLRMQALPIEEIVVVDNNAEDALDMQLAVQEILDNELPKAKLIREPRSGLDVARNTGVHAANGTIVAFVDDDVEAHPNWSQQIRRAFTDADIYCVTGLVLPAELDTLEQTAFEAILGGFARGFVPIRFDGRFFKDFLLQGAPVWRIGAGANMAFRSTALSRIGLFDELLGAGAAGCSDDSEYWYRILADGYACRYDPTAVVFHHHRKTEANLTSQAYYYMRGHGVALITQWQRYRHWGNLRRLLLTLPLLYLASIFRMALRLPGYSSLLYRKLLLAQISGFVSSIPSRLWPFSCGITGDLL